MGLIAKPVIVGSALLTFVGVFVPTLYAANATGAEAASTVKDEIASERATASVFLDVKGDRAGLSEVPVVIVYEHAVVGSQTEVVYLDASKGELCAAVPAGVIRLLDCMVPDSGHGAKESVWINVTMDSTAMFGGHVLLRPGVRVKIGTVHVCPIRDISVASVVEERLRIPVADAPSNGEGRLELSVVPFRGGAGYDGRHIASNVTLCLPPGDVVIGREELSGIVLDFHAAMIAESLRGSRMSGGEDETPSGIPHIRMTSSEGRMVYGYTIIATVTQRDSEGRVVFAGRTALFEFSFPTKRDVVAEGRKLVSEVPFSSSPGVILLSSESIVDPANGATGVEDADDSKGGARDEAETKTDDHKE